jgi:predicted dehydrogenase
MLRGALIGAGNAAMNGHLPAYLNDNWLQEKVEIVAAADLSEGNLAMLRAHIPPLRIHRSAAKLLAAEGLDFIDICAPPHAHPYLIRLASQRGCHILCEQPLAAGLTEGREIQQYVATRRIVFMPCHQYRFSPLWQIVHQRVGEHEIGEVHLAQFEVFRLRADSGNGRWKADWRTNPHIGGGGIIFDIGTHYFYLIFSLFGLPQSVSARIAKLAHSSYDVEDTALIVMEYPSLLVQINLTWAADHRENRARLIGTKGNIELRGDTIVLQRGDDRCEWVIEGASTEAAHPQWYGRLFREFVYQIETKNYSTAFLEEAANTLRCAELCYRSAKTEKTCRFSDLELSWGI